MVDILTLATLIAPVTAGVVQGVKQSKISKRLVPLVALIIGLLLGVAAFPFTDLEVVERLWAGGISGLAAVGLFEIAKHVTPDKEE
ncbi:holin [Geomicrobium sp. JCM 19038]|uniref:holin n=1 Tax=Geomicrobium sp. JCM 19038 TaxID=1460635 RepID=UPI0005A7DD15|nr:holin [Geomicrobium sp. JCM 19038]